MTKDESINQIVRRQLRVWASISALQLTLEQILKTVAAEAYETGSRDKYVEMTTRRTPQEKEPLG